MKRYATRAVALAALATWGFFTQSAPAADTPAADLKSKRDSQLQSVCGPRCVRCVLRYFDRDADLFDLIREMQGGDVDQPSSLEAVSTALENRDIRTFAMRLVAGAVLCWHYPVVVHLQEEGKPAHFSVWMPTSTWGVTDLWMGPGLVQTMTSREFGRRRSGAVLLTSDGPIADPSAAVTSPRRIAANALLYTALGVAAATAVSWCVISVRRRRAGALRSPSTILVEE